MLLSDRDLKWHIDNGDLKLDPWDPAMLQPSSIELTLADTFMEFYSADEVPIIDCDQPPCMIGYRTDDFVMPPGQLFLASTVEVVTLSPALAARVEGKSSIGRLGVAIHVTAGFIDPGFSGQITLELVNHGKSSVRLRPGMKIGQLCVFKLSSAAENPYGSSGLGSRYQGQMGPTASRSWQG